MRKRKKHLFLVHVPPGFGNNRKRLFFLMQDTILIHVSRYRESLNIISMLLNTERKRFFFYNSFNSFSMVLERSQSYFPVGMEIKYSLCIVQPRNNVSTLYFNIAWLLIPQGYVRTSVRIMYLKLTMWSGCFTTKIYPGHIKTSRVFSKSRFLFPGAS